MTGATMVFDIAGRYTIADSIADDSPVSLPSGNTYTPGSGAGESITKQGTGALILDGTNTYAGTTLVNAGVFGGNGILAGPVTLASGAQIAPGDPAINSGVDMLTTGPVTWNGGGVMAFQLNASAADSDFLLVGALTKGSAGTFKFHFSTGDLPPVAGTTYTLIRSTGTIGFSAGDFSFDTDATYQSLTGSFDIVRNDIQFKVNTLQSDRIFANSFD